MCQALYTHMILFNPQSKVSIIALPFLSEEPEYPRGQITCLRSLDYRGKARTGNQSLFCKLPPQGFRLRLLLAVPHQAVWDGSQQLLSCSHLLPDERL